jgi:hypothetical protein
MTTNGLKNFPEIRESLSKDAAHLLVVVHAESGHLADVYSGLMTIQSSIQIKIDKLKEEFKTQKEAKI